MFCSNQLYVTIIYGHQQAGHKQIGKYTIPCTYCLSCGQPYDDHIRLKQVADLNETYAYTKCTVVFNRNFYTTLITMV